MGFSEIEKSTYSDLFDCICYSPNNSHAMSCLGKLLEVQSLNSYLEKEVLPYLHQFVRSCLECTHCIGYNVTSPAESMNNMLKRNLPDRHLSLLESRSEFQSTINNHYHLIEEQLFTRRLPLNDQFYQIYTPTITKEINYQIEKSKKVVLEKEEYEYYTHKALCTDSPNRIYRLNEWHCDCNLSNFNGIPCCHLISLHKQLYNEFPTFFIDSRWKRRELIFEDDDQLITNENPNLPENTEGQQESSEESKIIDETYHSKTYSNLSQSERYLRLFHVAKTICSLASNNPDILSQIGENFQRTLSSLRGITLLDNNEEIESMNLNEFIDTNEDIIDDFNEDDNDSVDDNSVDGDSDDDDSINDDSVDDNSNVSNANINNKDKELDSLVIGHIDVPDKRKGRPTKLKKAEAYTKHNYCLICISAHSLVDCPFYDD